MLTSILCFQGEKVLQNDEFTRDLFRFLQLLCEGHNSGKWNRFDLSRDNNIQVQNFDSFQVATFNTASC